MAKNLKEFAFEVWGEDPFADVCTYLFRRPEAASAELVFAWTYRPVIDAAVDIDKFFLTVALEDIVPERLRCELRYSQFFADLTLQGIANALPEIYVPANSRVPFVGLYVFPCRAMLQIELSATIEDMQVDNWM